MKNLEIKLPGTPENADTKTVPVKVTSKQFSWKLIDFLKGAIMAVGTPVLYLIQEMIPNYPLSPIEKAALSAFVTYLLKNFFTTSQVTIKTSELKAPPQE